MTNISAPPHRRLGATAVRGSVNARGLHGVYIVAPLFDSFGRRTERSYGVTDFFYSAVETPKPGTSVCRYGQYLRSVWTMMHRKYGSRMNGYWFLIVFAIEQVQKPNVVAIVTQSQHCPSAKKDGTAWILRRTRV